MSFIHAVWKYISGVTQFCDQMMIATHRRIRTNVSGHIIKFLLIAFFKRNISVARKRRINCALFFGCDCVHNEKVWLFVPHATNEQWHRFFLSLSLFKFICLILCCGMLNCHVLSYWCISLKNIRWKASSTLRCIVFVQMHAYAELQQTLSWSNEWQQKMGIVSPSIDSHLKVMVKSKMVLNETRFFEKCLVMRNFIYSNVKFCVDWRVQMFSTCICIECGDK